MKNTLYYGDNLDILREYVKDESVDLVYLDPPFNSNQQYNVLFAERNGTRSAAQIAAFEDTWRWDRVSESAYQYTVEAGGRVSEAMQGLRMILGTNDVLAYLSMMAPRLVELRRVLKPTGSLYLHCDPTASHYLKLVLDAVFGPRSFRNEIVWRRSSAHSDTKQGMKRCGRIHDTLLLYSGGAEPTWNPIYQPYDKDYIESFYRHIDENGRRYRLSDLTAAKPGGDTLYEWKGVKPYKGRYWAYSKEKMEKFERQGRLHYSKSGIPSYKRYLDEMPGVPLQDVWTDLSAIGSGAAERLGYPTQKPEALLERILRASSNSGDIVLDPFCGCGTTIVVAERLKRTWIGIDITHLAISLMKTRLSDAFGNQVKYQVIGEPVSLPGAMELAQQDPFQFQYWALGLLNARPTEQKKGADRGIDGRLYFHDEPSTKRTKQVIFSVKAGKTGVAHVRDLVGVLSREKAQIGVLVSMQEPTKAMRKEAASAGFYKSEHWQKSYPRVQLITVEEALEGKQVDFPPTPPIRKRARRVNVDGGEQTEAF